MHILQSKQTKLGEKESQELLEKLNISKGQLPKINMTDPSIQDDCQKGDIFKIERSENDELNVYFRVVV